MMHTEKEEPKELDYSTAPTPEYTIEDPVKMITLKNLGIEGGNKAMFQEIINQVVMKVHELENKYKKISKKLLAKLEVYLNQLLKFL
jgi:hypothetical protein